MLPTERTRGAAAAAIQPSAPGSQQLSRTGRGKCSGRRPPGLGAPLSSGRRARAQAFTCFIFPSLGAGRQGQRSAPTSHRSGRAGRDSALRLPPSSFPSRAQGRSRRRLPPLLQQPTSNRPLGLTAQAPAPRRGGRLASGAYNCRHRRAERAQGSAPHRSLDLLFLLFPPPPPKD